MAVHHHMRALGYKGCNTDTKTGKCLFIGVRLEQLAVHLVSALIKPVTQGVRALKLRLHKHKIEACNVIMDSLYGCERELYNLRILQLLARTRDIRSV